VLFLGEIFFLGSNASNSVLSAVCGALVLAPGFAPGAPFTGDLLLLFTLSSDFASLLLSLAGSLLEGCGGGGLNLSGELC